MDKQNRAAKMTQAISPERVRELVQMAKNLSHDECQLLLVAVSLQTAQECALREIEEFPRDYEDVEIYPGEMLWGNFREHAASAIETITDTSKFVDVAEKYDIMPMFDLQLQSTVVANPVE